MNAEKLKQMQDQVRIGGKGSVRRKKKVIVREHTSDEKKVQAVLKKIGLSEIPNIDEVQMVKSNGEIIYFNNPKLMALPSANTFSISGHAEIKTWSEMWPSLLNQLRMNSLASFFPDTSEPRATDSELAAIEADSDDDDVPDLVDNFDVEACLEASQ